jgi:hypothetical protein
MPPPGSTRRRKSGGPRDALSCAHRGQPWRNKDQKGQRNHRKDHGLITKSLGKPRSTEGLRFNTAIRLAATARFHREEVASKPVRLVKTKTNKDKKTKNK